MQKLFTATNRPSINKPGGIVVLYRRICSINKLLITRAGTLTDRPKTDQLKYTEDTMFLYTCRKSHLWREEMKEATEINQS